MTAGPLAPPPPRPGRRPLGWAAGLLLVAAAGYFGGRPLYHDSLLRGAARAEQARDFARAADLLARYRAARPDDPAGRLLAARLGWRDKLGGPFPPGWDKPVRDHLTAAEAAPELIDRAGHERQVVAALAGDRAALAAVARRAGAGGPDAVPLLEAVARGHLDAHRLNDALGAADRLLAAAPDHPLGHFWRGLALDLSGREGPEAERAFRRAVDLAPADWDMRLWLAGYLARFPDTAREARGLYDGLVRERPDDREALVGLGTTAAATGDRAAARPPLEKLLAGDPRHGPALAALGRAALDDGRLADAEPLLRRAVEVAPFSFDANTHLAACLYAQGKEAEAVPFRERAERTKADRTRARELLRQTATDRPTAAVAYELGTLHLRFGEAEVGRNWLRRALEIDPGHEPARKALAESK